MSGGHPRIVQVIANLIRTSLKHARRAAVTLNAVENNHHVELRVSHGARVTPETSKDFCIFKGKTARPAPRRLKITSPCQGNDRSHRRGIGIESRGKIRAALLIKLPTMRSE